MNPYHGLTHEQETSCNEGYGSREASLCKELNLFETMLHILQANKKFKHKTCSKASSNKPKPCYTTTCRHSLNNMEIKLHEQRLKPLHGSTLKASSRFTST